jgi:hypothetical protein
MSHIEKKIAVSASLVFNDPMRTISFQPGREKPLA